MSDKNWLIRTTMHQIIGPLSKDKVLEYFKKGSLGPNDEVCSGNGYWFYIREKELVELYLLGDSVQSFNPISEAQTVLANQSTISPLQKSLKKSQQSSTDNTVLIDRSLLDELKNKNEREPTLEHAEKIEPIKVPNNDDLEYPEIDQIISSAAPVEIEQKSVSGSGGMFQYLEKPSYKIIPDSTLNHTEIDDIVILPDSDDLDYPDLDAVKEKASSAGIVKPVAEPSMAMSHLELTSTTPGSTKGVVIQGHKKETTPPVIPSKKQKSEKIQLAERKKPTSQSQDFENQIQEAKNQSQKKSNQLKRKNKEEVVAPHLEKKNDTYILLIIILLLFFLGAGIMFYFNKVINRPF